ncbi:MAG: sodium-dependent transporter [Saprospiraceae bacterium]|nr:sodium-dependent transporter [Saprospiraceae bacterium]MBK7789576.1 sodium-dependent transporter [Saprospiraceae bacterium]
MSAGKENWGSRIGLILAMAGNAVGLGNFLRFPAQAIQNGGGAFIIPYLVCFLLMGIPLLYIEWSMGRFGGKFGQHSTPFILDAMGGKQKIWKYFGVFGIFTNIAVAAYYCYLESWTLSWAYHSILGDFNGMTQVGVQGFFDNYIALGSAEPIIFWILCLALNTYILSKGLSGGVEMAAKIGMPLLIIFGIFLAYKGYATTAGVDGAINDGMVGLNFLWTPDFQSIWSPKVWLAAAGQIFFTLSVGMGTIHCYASYMKENEDVALNSMSAGWMNEFVEVVLGSAIVIPIAVGYLGIDKVKELGGFAMGFVTLPYLFAQWGDLLSKMAGFMWFGLLFFAGITSSLAMGTPMMGFLKDNFKWTHNKSAIAFGALVFILGVPCVMSQNGFNEYDYWAGTVSLVVFALAEIILFAWVFGMEKGWSEITRGADIHVPGIYKPIIQYITPVFLLSVFVGSIPDIITNISSETDLWGWISRGTLITLFIVISYYVKVASNNLKTNNL